MKTDKDNTNIQNHMNDIQALYPGLLVLSPRQLAKMRNKSLITLSRERLNGVGPDYKVSNLRIEYPVRAIGEWMNKTINTA